MGELAWGMLPGLFIISSNENRMFIYIYNKIGYTTCPLQTSTVCLRTMVTKAQNLPRAPKPKNSYWLHLLGGRVTLGERAFGQILTLSDHPSWFVKSWLWADFKVRVNLDHFAWCDLTYFWPRHSIFWYMRHVSIQLLCTSEWSNDTHDRNKSLSGPLNRRPNVICYVS